MKRIAKLLTAFVMLVTMLMPSAFALGDYAVWTGEWPFNDNGAYIGFTSSTADYGVAGDSYSSQNMYYGLNLDNDQVIYHDDYYNFVDRDLNDFVPTNWEPLNVNNSTFPALNPLIAQAVFDVGEVDYVWKDNDDNLWITIVVGNDIIHIDKNKIIYGSRFDELTYDEASQVLNSMDATTVTTPYYDPAGLRNLLETSDIPDPDKPSIEYYIITIGIIVVVAAIVYFIRRKLNKKRRAILEAEAPMAEVSEDNSAPEQTVNADTTEPEKEPERVAYCSRCGTKVDADAKFCPNCGTQLK